VKPADAELVARCRRQEPAAFEELYRQHAGRVFNLARRMAGSRSEGEDLLQDIFVLVFRKLESFKGESSLGTWIYRLATNHCLDHLRSRENRTRQLSDPLAEDDVRAASRSARPLGAERLDLERAIARLPPGYRAAFVLHDVEGFEHHEVAAILGVAEGTSKSQVHKARLKIREYLTAPRPAVAGVTRG
jgi:RNA polymerase sigma-70 factor (ECF subfamily)